MEDILEEANRYCHQKNLETYGRLMGLTKAQAVGWATSGIELRAAKSQRSQGQGKEDQMSLYCKLCGAKMAGTTITAHWAVAHPKEVKEIKNG